MALTTLLESQRDVSKLMQDEASHLVDFLAPKMWFSSDVNILSDLKTQPSEQACQFGQRCSFEFQVSDVLNMAYISFELPEDTTVCKAMAAMHMIDSYRVLWGNVQIHSVTNYRAFMVAELARMSSDDARRLMYAASAGANGAPGAIAAGARRSHVMAPIPIFLDRLLKRSKSGEVLDLRGVSGRIRIELQLNRRSDLYVASPQNPGGNTQPKAELVYNTYVASAPGEPGNIVASLDFKEDLVYKSLDVETTAWKDLAAGATTTIDLTSFSGNKRMLAVVCRKGTVAQNEGTPAAGFLNNINSEYPAGCKVVAGGRDYHDYRFGPNQMALHAYLAGAQDADKDNTETDLPASASGLEVLFFPISVDQETKNYSGGINISRISKTEISITNHIAAAVPAGIPLSVAVVLYTDVLYSLENRQLVRRLQA